MTMPTESPDVSAILLSHNCPGVVGAALHSLLAQECEPMEVIVSDDASTDDTWLTLQKALDGYAGPHRVSLRRRDTNAGSKSAHLNDVFPLATGRYLVSFDGDDIAEPQRVRRLLETFRADPGISAVYSDYAFMDSAGQAGARRGVRHPPPGTDERRWFARADSFASGATLAVRRDVVEAFGLLDPRINEDVVLPFRASLLGEVRYIDEALVRVRRWEGSLTAAHERFASLESYRAWWRRGIDDARRQLGSRLDDCDTAERLELAPVAELEQLRAVARASLAEAEDSCDLVAPSLAARLVCFSRLASAGMDREDFLQSAALVFAPGLYLKYKRRKR